MYVYSVGLIDYLKHYGFDETIEHSVKAFKAKGESNLMSCVPPKIYAERFFHFMQDSVITNQ